MASAPRLAAILALLVLAAGCSSPDASDDAPTPGATPTVTASTVPTPAATPSPMPSATPPSTPPTMLGVVLDEMYDYSAHGGNETIRLITVGPGVTSIRFDITSGGPPADGSFQSAVVDFFFPRSTSPFLAELPGQQAHSFNFTRYVDPSSPGDWKIRFAGQGKTTVHVVVTLQ